MRDIKEIVIHCSDSGFGSQHWIRDIHTKEFGWDDTGYHFVILNGIIKKDLYFHFCDGQIEIGRPIEKSGAHVRGHNKNTIGICLIGKDKFTVRQLHSLDHILIELMNKYSLKSENIKGHYEYDTANGKTCPNIDMDNLRKNITYKMSR